MQGTNDNILTTKQRDALEKIRKIMEAEFTGYVLTYDIADANPEAAHITGHQYHGGHALATGLLSLAQAKIQHDHLGLKF